MKNLGYQTDFIFLEQESEFTQLEDYTLVRSPKQPTFYFGNLLLLNEPPRNGDQAKLEATFKEAFKDMEGVKHFTFCWGNDKKTDVTEFVNAGYEYDELFVLKAQAKDLIHTHQLNDQVMLRPFENESDWEQWVELELLERKEGHGEEGYRSFLKGQKARYQNLYQAERGNFYGAFIGDELVASAGLFKKENLGRFQSVITKSTHRRQGICKTLIYYICCKGFEELDTLVIAAEKHYHALRIYESFGFQSTDSQYSLCWWEREA